jgi:hypothetical protein
MNEINCRYESHRGFLSPSLWCVLVIALWLLQKHFSAVSYGTAEVDSNNNKHVAL